MRDYQGYIESDEWARRRQQKISSTFCWHGRVLCDHCRCFVSSNAIDVHHLTYERLGAELPEDLLVLCFWCHKLAHGRSIPDDRDCTPATWTIDELKSAFSKELLKCGDFDDALDAAIMEVIPIVLALPERTYPRPMADVLRDWWQVRGRKVLGPESKESFLALVANVSQ